MEFIKAAVVNNLKPGEKIGVVLEGKSVLLVNLDDQIYAIGGKCTIGAAC